MRTSQKKVSPVTCLKGCPDDIVVLELINADTVTGGMDAVCVYDIGSFALW